MNKDFTVSRATAAAVASLLGSVLAVFGMDVDVPGTTDLIVQGGLVVTSLVSFVYSVLAAVNRLRNPGTDAKAPRA